MNEIELIEHAVRGDLDAFNSLVLSYEDTAYNVAYRILNDSEQAADATQVAVISMYRKLSTYRGGSFKGWFLRIVTNACYDELRRVKRRPTVPLEPETDEGEMVESPSWIEDPTAGPEEVLDTKEMENAIQHCLNGLEDKFKIVLIMVDLSGEDYETVAAIIQSPMGTVKSRLARARQKMQECLQGAGELLPAKYRLNSEANNDHAN